MNRRGFLRTLLGGVAIAAVKLPAIPPTALDGEVLFKATSPWGVPRFGVMTGNILGGSGVCSVREMQEDFRKAIECLRDAKYPDGAYWIPREAKK